MLSPNISVLTSCSFGHVGRHMLHVLQHLLRLHSEPDLQISPTRDIVEALVAASKFGTMSTRKTLLKTAAELQNDRKQLDTQAMIVHRQSVLLRLCKKVSESQRIIREFLDSPFIQPNPKLTSLLGLLHVSQAENWAYLFNHQMVYKEAQKWEPGDHPSSMQLYALRNKLKVLGQSYKGEGLFEDAMSAFKGCLAAMKPQDSERYLIQSHLADICCEMEYLKRKKMTVTNVAYLDEAEKVVSSEIRYLRTSNRHSKHLRRLLLSLLEIEMVRGRQTVAECLIEELLSIHHGLVEHDINDQVGHVRTLMAWARISEPAEAVVRWQTAFQWNQIYNPSEEDVFTCGVIFLFISLAYFQVGDTDESWASFTRAAETISRKEPQFLMPGIGTYLYDFARRELWSLAGWLLPGQSPLL